MMLPDVMVRLQSLGDEKTRKHNTKAGVGENQFGVKAGDLRLIAKEIRADPALAAELWKTGNYDAMLLATLLMKPKLLSTDELAQLLASAPYDNLVDWLGTNVIKPHPQKENVRESWMNSQDIMTARMGWSLTTERVIKNPEGLNLNALLDRIESEMADAPRSVQWTMNYCLAEIGIKFAEHRARAIAIGEKIGAFKDFPVSKGCTSPYAPIWITAMVERNA